MQPRHLCAHRTALPQKLTFFSRSLCFSIASSKLKPTHSASSSGITNSCDKRRNRCCSPPGEEHASLLFTPLPQTPFLQQEHYCRQTSSTVPLLISFLAKLPSPFSFSLFQSVQHCVCCSASPSTTSVADHRPRMTTTISYIKLNNHTQAVRAPHCSIDKNSPCCW